MPAINDPRPEGPTLNRTYNGCLANWRHAGCPSEPECEECGCDMTGRHVHETRFGWYCSEACVDASGDREPDDNWREDFHSDG